MVNELSTRQKEVLIMLANGYNAKQTGVRLFISEHTVRSHLIIIKELLRAKNVVEAVAMAIRQGIIE